MDNAAMRKTLCVTAPVLSAIILIYLGPRAQLTYDSLWHVFIARQDEWTQFWFEVAGNAHPPLFYLVLKAAILIGKSPLIYRLPSILAIVTGTALMCPIAGRLVANRWLPGMASLVFGLSYSAIDIGLEVRAYALATCLTLAALFYYLRLAESAFSGTDWKARGLFAGFMTLALLTHYSVAFVVASTVLSPLVLAAADRDFRARLSGAWATARLANLVTFGTPVVVFGVFYLGHARHWAGRIQHLPGFMFDRSRESLVGFVSRVIRDEIGLFTPGGPTGFAILAAAGVAAFVVLVRQRRHIEAERRAMALLPLTMLVIMGGLTLAAAVAGRYPFGGLLRHQFFLMPFTVLSLIVILDQIGQILPVGWWRRALVVGVATGCAASVAVWMVPFTVKPGLRFQGQMDMFQSSVPGASAVYVGQFSLIAFFMHHHEWEWRQRPAASPAQFQVWTVSKDGRELLVCRDQAHWMLDALDAELYSNLEQCLEATGAPHVALFGLGRKRSGQLRKEAAALMEELAAKAGLRLVAFANRQGAVFATFERAQR
jgi:hypothetical protein